MPTIREAVDALEERLFVGRARDLEAFGDFLDRPEPEILNVHGPGGVGKSALLAAFRRTAERAGRSVTAVDGRSVPAEPEALLAAAGGVSELNRRRPLLLVDAFEELEELTRWLQEEFLPNLDTEVRVVVAGRFPLGPAWSDWQKIIRSIALRGLSGHDVKEYLARRGIEDAVLVQQVQSATGGLPLAVTLAADMVQQLGVQRFEAAPEWRLAVRSLVERLLAEAPDPDLREVLEAGSVVRQFDEATLAATLGREDISVAFDRLCRLSVVRPSDHGLMLHDDLRRMLAEDLRWRKPERFRDLRLAALAHLRERARTAPPGERSWLVAERLYLWGNEVVQSILFREDEPGLVYVEPGRPEDAPDVLEVRSHWLRAVLPSQQAMDYTEFTPEEDSAWLERLLGHDDVRLRVARDQRARAIGFHATIPISAGSVELLQAHPVYAVLLRAYFGKRLDHVPAEAGDSPFHVLVQAAYGTVLPEATDAALLRDLVGLLSRGGVFLDDHVGAGTQAAVRGARVPLDRRRPAVGLGPGAPGRRLRARPVTHRRGGLDRSDRRGRPDPPGGRSRGAGARPPRGAPCLGGRRRARRVEGRRPGRRAGRADGRCRARPGPSRPGAGPGRRHRRPGDGAAGRGARVHGARRQPRARRRAHARVPFDVLPAAPAGHAGPVRHARRALIPPDPRKLVLRWYCR